MPGTRPVRGQSACCGVARVGVGGDLARDSIPDDFLEYFADSCTAVEELNESEAGGDDSGEQISREELAKALGCTVEELEEL